MQSRSVLGYGAAALGVLGLALFVGWWQVDGPVIESRFCVTLARGSDRTQAMPCERHTRKQ